MNFSFKQKDGYAFHTSFGKQKNPQKNTHNPHTNTGKAPSKRGYHYHDWIKDPEKLVINIYHLLLQ